MLVHLLYIINNFSFKSEPEEEKSVWKWSIVDTVLC